MPAATPTARSATTPTCRAELIFGWSGVWDELPTAHAAAIAFDLLTLLGLFFLGRRIRGPTLGTVFAYLWAAYPFTLWALSSNTNDALVALLVVSALLVITSAPARGRGGRARRADQVRAAGAGAAAVARGGPSVAAQAVGGRVRRRIRGDALVAMLPVLLDDNLRAFWHDSIAYQAGRVTPFSVWGLWGGLGFEQHVVEGAAVALAGASRSCPAGAARSRSQRSAPPS